MENNTSRDQPQSTDNDTKNGRGRKRKSRRRYRELAARLSALEKLLGNKLASPCESADHENLSTHVASHVDSVVGLRETLTYKRTSLKVIWAVLLVMGAAATIFYIYRNISDFLDSKTATKIKVDKHPSYAFPPLVFCPPWWMSVKDAEQMGLPFGGLLYSMGYSLPWYFKYLVNVDLKHGTTANASFMDFYSKNEFHSLAQFFKAVSPNFLDLYSENTTLNDTLLTGCEICKNLSAIEKKIFYPGICYVFELKNVSANSTGDPPTITLFNHYYGDGVFNQSIDNWYFDILPNVINYKPAFALKNNRIYSGKLSVQRNIIMQGCDKTPNYSQQLCIDRCLISQDSANAETLSEWSDNTPDNETNCWTVPSKDEILNVTGNVTTTTAQPPSSSDNSTDNATLKNDTKVDDDNEIVLDCYDKCKPPCDRMIYDLFFEEKNLDDSSPNSSTVQLELKHGALFQGGIITWEEVETTTFADFTSNLGGTLGLFLGCTVMTIAQFILSLIDYVLERKRDKNPVISGDKPIV